MPLLPTLQALGNTLGVRAFEGLDVEGDRIERQQIALFVHRQRHGGDFQQSVRG